MVRQASWRDPHGFTIVELLVVVAIIGVLAAIAVPVFLSQINKADTASTEANVTNAYKVISALGAEWDGTTTYPAGQPIGAASTVGVMEASGEIRIAAGYDPTDVATLCVESTSPQGDTYHRDSAGLGLGACSGGLTPTPPPSGGGAPLSYGQNPINGILHVTPPTTISPTGTPSGGPYAFTLIDSSGNAAASGISINAADGALTIPGPIQGDSVEVTVCGSTATVGSTTCTTFTLNTPRTPPAAADLHIFVTNGNEVNLPTNGAPVTYYDLGDPSTAQWGTSPALGPLPAGTVLRAKFDWDNRGTPAVMNWFSDVTQFGLNSATGQRNQLASGAYAFSGLAASGLTALPGLDTSNLTTTVNMFDSARAFNQNINGWDVSNVVIMEGMFRTADSFNQPLGSWNTANVTNMRSMFRNANAFNQPLGSWNIANVTSTFAMFYSARNFNQPLGSWNTAKVTNMNDMFRRASVFNQPLGSWNTVKVTSMDGMFADAVKFDQNISPWNVSRVSTHADFDLGTLGTWTAAEKPSFP